MDAIEKHGLSLLLRKHLEAGLNLTEGIIRIESQSIREYQHLIEGAGIMVECKGSLVILGKFTLDFTTEIPLTCLVGD